MFSGVWSQLQPRFLAQTILHTSCVDQCFLFTSLMTEMNVSKAILTGGCQCGSVRFSVTLSTELKEQASICHCRMCQKAFGNVFAALVRVRSKESAFRWTRGKPQCWRSSNHVQRGFCGKCGTPITYEAGEHGLTLAIGAFDKPYLRKPTVAFGIQGKIDWTDSTPSLPLVAR